MPILANKQKKCKLSKWIESDYAKKVGRYKKDSKGKYYKGLTSNLVTLL